MMKITALIAVFALGMTANAQFFPIPDTNPAPTPMPSPEKPPEAASAESDRVLPVPLPNVTDFTVTCLAPRPNTTFMVFTEGGSVDVEVVHHNGLEFMPIHEGIFVPQDLPILQARANVMKKLGSYYRFGFPLSKCKDFGDMLYHCTDYSQVARPFNGHSIRPISLYTSRAEIKSFIGTEKYFDITLQLEIDGKNYFQSMRYNPNECTKARRPL